MSVQLIDSMGSDEMVAPIVRTGPLVIDLDGRTVTDNGGDVLLARREWDVLAYLAGRLGKFCDTDDVFWRVFAPEMVVGRHRVDGMDRTVRVSVYRLRRRLGTAASLVENRLGFGYRLRQVAP